MIFASTLLSFRMRSPWISIWGTASLSLLITAWQHRHDSCPSSVIKKWWSMILRTFPFCFSFHTRSRVWYASRLRENKFIMHASLWHLSSISLATQSTESCTWTLSMLGKASVFWHERKRGWSLGSLVEEEVYSFHSPAAWLCSCII